MSGYDYVIKKAIKLFKLGATIGSIGYSQEGRLIPYIHTGAKTGKQIIVTGGIHAREHVTADLVLAQAEFALRYPMGVYFIPLVNPDGAEIALQKTPPPDWLTSRTELFKANARGVDLNVNFDAKWGLGEHNITHRAPENYIGEYPFSESETRALRDFTRQILPDATVSYHAKGREIYYDFTENDRLRRKNLAIAQKLNQKLGYALKKTPNSVGGYKDWCQNALAIPAFTIEIGDDKIPHPLTKKDIKEDVLRNLTLPQTLHECLSITKNS